ncbi:type II toxin-antitoxin system RelE/ParE family toxin [Gaiella sp.]|uniref:type II toxin-antitoxin system RelE family toxin n=1 Tax=Gaiella sp. TaxID=2663207 RepID=UPI0032664D93
MARVEVSRAAVEDIAWLRVTHSLPPDTNERIKSSLRALEQFPRLGAELAGGGWEGFRFLLGPWRWMVIVYEVLDEGERVAIVTVQDGRSSSAAPTRATG